MKKVVFSGLVSILVALVHEPAIAQYDLGNPSRIIRAEDGLPNHYMRGLVQDAYGFIWIGSYDGLSRFDGKRIVVFRHKAGDSLSLTQSSVLCLAADPDNGQVWVGTFAGLNVYQPATGRFRTYTHDDQDTASLPSNYVSWIYADRQSTVWVGTRSNKLCRLDTDKNKFIQYAPQSIKGEGPEQIQVLVQDGLNDSLLWLGTNKRLVSFNKYRKTFSYGHPAITDIAQIYAHANGNLYISDKSGQLTVYQPSTGKRVRKIVPQAQWRFGRMFRKSADELWINCNNGIAVLKTEDHVVSYPWQNDPAQKKKYEIDLIDRQGRIWSASTAGLKVYDPASTQFSNYIYENTGASAPYITQRIVEDTRQAAVFLNANAGNGVHRLDLRTRKWLHIPKPKNYPDDLFYGTDLALLENGQLLVLAEEGIFTLSTDGRSMVPHPVSKKLPAEKNWLNIFVDSKGYIWLGGLNNGVLKIDSRTWEVTSLAKWLPACRQPRFRWTFYEDSQQNIWITVCGGMAFYAYREDAFHFLLDESNPENTFKTPKDFVEDRDGILWVSDEQEGQLGMIDLKAPKKGIYRKILFTENTLESSFRILKGVATATLGVSKLAVDRANNLWTFGPSGLLKIHPDRKSIEIYNELDGLRWLDEELKVPSVNQIETLSTGEIIVGFRKGLSIFDPSKLNISKERPQPYLIAFHVYNNAWESDSSLFVTRRIDLKYWENYFSFDFSSIGFTNPDHHQYQYKLEGVDENWVYSGTRSYAAYTNIAGGHYTFMIKAANRDGIWNETPLKIDLSIAIPWWNRLWFKGCVILLLLAGVYSLYRYQLFQVRRVERLRADFENKLAGVELAALRSQMNPHFIFNCLNSIESYIIKNETRKASEYLNDFSRLIRLILQNSRSNYVPIRDELEALTLYMDMENLRLGQRFNYNVSLDERLDLDNTEIPPMLIQPYVENAIWHGLMHKKESGTILIELKKEGDFLLCAIEDNGVGRKRSAELKSKSQKKTSMGMNITQERIDIINKAYDTETSVRVIDLVSAEGEALGTRVELRIMLE